VNCYCLTRSLFGGSWLSLDSSVIAVGASDVEQFASQPLFDCLDVVRIAECGPVSFPHCRHCFN